MTRRRSRAPLLLALWCAGCLSQVERGEPSRDQAGERPPWLAARGLDLLDMASVRVFVGPGLLAHARATRWIALGAGALGRPESWAGGFEMKVYGLGWCLREGGAWTERRAEIGLSTFYYCESGAHVLGGNRTVFPPAARHPFDVGAQLHLALVGAAAEVRLDEVLDFVSGWFGLDLRQDDVPPPPSP